MGSSAITREHPARVALVTGAARGIGRAVALALARDGRVVAVADLLEPQAQEVAGEIELAGGHARAIELDVTDPASVASGAARAAAELGPVDVLVNCAGWDQLRPFLDTDESFWRRVIALNYEGCLRTTHALLPGMLDRGWGRIVNVSSDAARVGSAEEAVYAGAKAAVIAFTKTVARESARRAVTANAVCPGPTDTAMLRSIETMINPDDPDAVRTAYRAAIPTGRYATPAEIANVVLFLLSDLAVTVTGAHYMADMGRTQVGASVTTVK